MTVWTPPLPVLKAMGCTEQFNLWERLTAPAPHSTTTTEQGDTP